MEEKEGENRVNGNDEEWSRAERVEGRVGWRKRGKPMQPASYTLF